MHALLTWLGHVPPVVLYLVLFVLAAAENVFPPLPTDTVVAFGTWLAARGDGSAIAAFLATWIGNILGALGMYVVGRRHGTAWIRARFPTLADEAGELRLRRLYARYGIFALMVSRFLPGVRALVPPFAGALQVPMASVAFAMASASAVWYGIIAYLAYRAGDWDAVMRAMARSGRVAAIVAGVALLAVVAVLLLRRLRSRRAA